MKPLFLVCLLATAPLLLRADDVKSLSDFQAAADKANETLTIPDVLPGFEVPVARFFEE